MSEQIKADINFVPFIDITLVLLIIFMVASQSMNRESSISVDLPSTSNVVERTPDKIVEDTIVISLQGNEYYFSSTFYSVMDKKLDSLDELNASVLSVKKQRENTKIFVRADKGVPYGKVTSVIDALKVNGVDSVNLVLDGGDRDDR